jgi:hypothetical protein
VRFLADAGLSNWFGVTLVGDSKLLSVLRSLPLTVLINAVTGHEAATFYHQPCYYLSSRGGPPTRLPLRWKFTMTWSAIEMNGMPLFIP